jgi:hypothetical protein
VNSSSTTNEATVANRTQRLTSRRVTDNDEKIMKKLADMSMNMMSSNSEQDSSEFKSNVSASMFSSKTSIEDIFKRNDELIKSKQKLPNIFADEKEDSSSEAMSELDKYLKDNAKIDGNLIETRKLDLRASQNTSAGNVKSRVHSKPSLDNLLGNLIRSMSHQDYKPVSTHEQSATSNSVNKNKIKFLNDLTDSSSNSSSDSSDSECENKKTKSALWIENYRKYKNNFK